MIQHDDDETASIEQANRELRDDEIRRELDYCESHIVELRAQVVKLAEAVLESASACVVNHARKHLHGREQIEHSIALLVRIGVLEAEIKRDSLQALWLRNHLSRHY